MYMVHQSSPVSGWPPSRPPGVVPRYHKNFALRKDMLQNTLYSCIYLWTKTSGSFWMYPTACEKEETLSGYHWERSFWQFTQIDYAQIDGFY